MNKNKELAKNTIVILAGKICTQFMSFFLMPLYTAVLSTEEYGIVDLIGTYTALIVPFILCQTDQALFRFLIDVRNDENGKKKILTTTLTFAIFQITAVILIFSVVQFFVSNKYKWFFLFNFLSVAGINIVLQSCRGLGDNFSYALGSFLCAFVQIIGNILFLLVFKLGVYGMLLSTIGANVLTFVFLFFKKRIYKYFQLCQFDKTKLKAILQYSLPLIPNATCWWLLNASDRTIVLNFLGVSSNGLLLVGHKFSLAYTTIYGIFNLSWTESAALHMSDSDREKFFSSVITNMFKLFMCMAIFIIACMPFVFPILINNKFHYAYNIIPIFILASMFDVISGLFKVIYVALKDTKKIAKTSIYPGLINIVVHLTLIKFIGLYASAVSTVVAFGIMAIYCYFDSKKYINICLPIKWIISIALMYSITCFVYYKGTVLLQAIVLLIVILISIVINKNIIQKGLIIILNKIKKN